MKFGSTIVLASAAALTRASFAGPCAEAQRFGVLSVNPSTFAPGDTITLSANFSCAVEWFGIVAKYLDYYISVPVDNNGHEPDILLAHHEPEYGTLSENFTVKIPYTNYFSGAAYTVSLDNTYAINGTDGSPVYIVGGTEYPVNITATA